MKRNKLLILFVTLILLLGIMTGCGSAPADEEGTPGESTESETPESTENETSSGDIDSAYLTSVLSQGATAMLEGISYDMTIDTAGQKTAISYFMEGEKIKMSGTMEGVESVTIIDGTSMISYDPVSKTGMKFAYEDDSTQADGTVDADLSDNFDDSSLTFLEKGEFDGEPCLIVSAKDTGDVNNMKMWINERLGMVVKMEVSTADGQVMTTEMTNIKTGKMPAGTFDVPADIEIVELPGM